MTVNLMLVTTDADDVSASAWAEMIAIAPQGQVAITDALVREAALLLEDAPLSKGRMVQAYPMDEDDCMSSLVCDFGPGLLAPEKLDAVRSLLAPYPDAIRLLDVVLKHGVQMRFSGSDMGRGAHLCGCTSPAEDFGDIVVNMGKGSMILLFEELGLSGYEEGQAVPFDEFAGAVANPPRRPHRGIESLGRLVAHGRERGATAVYWA